MAKEGSDYDNQQFRHFREFILPEHLRICQYCSSNEVENKTHFILFCNKYDTIRNSLVEDIISKYPEFDY